AQGRVPAAATPRRPRRGRVRVRRCGRRRQTRTPSWHSPVQGCGCMSDPSTRPRTRREPPRFREVTVHAVERLSPWMMRVSLSGPDLAEFTVEEPAASVRLLLPSAPGAELVRPAWNGNEFLLPDGRRPVIRTLTPLRSGAREFDVQIVLHDGGRASQWAK